MPSTAHVSPHRHCPLSFQGIVSSGHVPTHFTDEQKRVLACIDRGLPYRQIERMLGVGRMTVASLAAQAGREPRKPRAHQASRRIERDIARLLAIDVGRNQIAASLGMTRQGLTRRLTRMGLRADLDERKQQQRMVRLDLMSDYMERQIPIATIAQTLKCGKDTIRRHLADQGINPHTYTTAARRLAISQQFPRMLLAMELVPRSWIDIAEQAGLQSNFFSAYRIHPRPINDIAARIAKPLGVSEDWLLGHGDPTLRGLALCHITENRKRVHERIRQALCEQGRTFASVSTGTGIHRNVLGKLCHSLRPYPYIMPLALTLRVSPMWLSGMESGHATG